MMTDTELAKNVGEQLKFLRINAGGQSIRAVSQKIGIDNTHLGAIERGESMPSLSMLNTLLKYYNRAFSSFFEEVEKMAA